MLDNHFTYRAMLSRMHWLGHPRSAFQCPWVTWSVDAHAWRSKAAAGHDERKVPMSKGAAAANMHLSACDALREG